MKPARYTVEAGRQIYRDGMPFLSIAREGTTAPHEADAFTHAVAWLLNRHDLGNPPDAFTGCPATNWHNRSVTCPVCGKKA